MTERFTFTVDRQHLVPQLAVDGNVIWSNETMDGVNATLSDTINDGYVTAEEECPTQYLSVLDTSSEISLENLNISLANPKLEAEEQAETFVNDEGGEQDEELTDQQVVVYTVDGSDELYGIQIAQDEEGNLQKYQFQFRKNAEGQLEAIPETIRVLPLDDETAVNTEHLEVEQITDETNRTHEMQIFVAEDNSNEHILPDNNCMENGEANENGDERLTYENEDVVEESVDIKPGLLALQNVKQEIQEQQVEYDPEDAISEASHQTFPEQLHTEEITNFSASEDVTQDADSNHLIDYENPLGENHIVPADIAENTEDMDMEYVTRDIKPHFIKQTHSMESTLSEHDFEHVEVRPDMQVPEEPVVSIETDAQEQEEMDEFDSDSNINDSDADDYQIVEGLHITGDVETTHEVPLEPVENIHSHTNILRHVLKTNQEQKIKKQNRLYLYVVQHPEKENVDARSLDNSNLCKPKVNPRSILKSSYAMLQTKNLKEEVVQSDERLSKRFARCKEAMQARIFNNFINKTTIPQAPVRKQRLPRKQKIKPVERMDEEIVVQEVMVSSNGFVETVDGEGFNKENLEVIEYVELTDSDDDYDPKKINKKKKKHRRKKIEITISDESEESIIELDESDEEVQEDSPTKRRRGRPPKNTPKPVPTEPLDSPSKKQRVEESQKPEIPCPKCDKTFPSQNSLKTHLQHHNLQSSLRSAALPQSKYACDDCETNFKNSVLLKRHVCTKAYPCGVCKKKFPDASGLAVHKRVHAKEQLLKSTPVAQISPKKLKPPAPTFKFPKKINNLKCKTCGRVCASLQSLNVHMKTHKEYSCNTCSTSFVSQLLLEKHLRESCVKTPQTQRRSTRLSVMGADVASGKPRETRSRLTAFIRVSCDVTGCSLTFNTYKEMFKHKVLIHGFHTPDRACLVEKPKSLYKERGEHSGVPPAPRLKDAFSKLVGQLDFSK